MDRRKIMTTYTRLMVVALVLLVPGALLATSHYGVLPYADTVWRTVHASPTNDDFVPIDVGRGFRLAWTALEGATTKEDLAREAHTLASSCRSFGLPAIGDKLACIEQHARFGETAGEPPCIDATGKELSVAAAALKATVERYQSEG